MWQAELNDGQFCSNNDKWEEIKGKIVALSILTQGMGGVTFHLPRNQRNYSKGLGASADINGEIQIISEWIACDTPAGRIKLRVNLATGDASVEV